MKSFLNRGRWGVLSVILSTLLVLTLIVSYAANLFKPQVNGFFGLSSYVMVEDKDTASLNTVYWTKEYSDKDALRAHIDEVCREVEGEGMVLLKNTGRFLPLASANPVVTLMGWASANINASFQGMREATDLSASTFPTLREALEADGVRVNETVWRFYTEGEGAKSGFSDGYGPIKNNGVNYVREVPWSAFSVSERTSISGSDAVILVLTRENKEGTDLSASGSDTVNGDYLALSGEELTILQELTRLKKAGEIGGIVVLLNAANPMQMDFLYRSDVDVDSCLWIGNVGSSGIYAVADVIMGRINPSGRLSDTYVRNDFSSPAMASWMLNEGKSFSQPYLNASEENISAVQRNYGTYTEGIYVGYRYYETRYADAVTGFDDTYIYENDVAFPFGYGLSYTQFEYSGFTVGERTVDGKYEVAVTVRNTGDAAGKETVQIYLQKPYDVDGYDGKYGIEKAAIELAGFAKTGLLAPGESETVTVSVEEFQFASYDANGAKTYILGTGDYYLAAGRDAHDALNNILAAQGAVQTRMTEIIYHEPHDMIGEASLARICFTKAGVDTESCRYSQETGAEVTNRLDSADMNRYEGRGDNSVRYVSRQDWIGTWPSEPVRFTITDTMKEDLKSNQADFSGENASMPVFNEQNGLTLVMLSNRANLLNDPGSQEISYQDELWEKLLNQMSFEELNNLISVGFGSVEGVPSIGKPLTNGGDVPTGLQNSSTRGRFPNEGIWASTFNTGLLKKIGDCFAEDAHLALRDNGEPVDITALWMPGINIHRTPYCGRAHEYFSEDPLLTGLMAQSEIEAIQAKGVISYPKHFAINDQDTNRSGIGIWLNEQEAREIMLEPWRYAVSQSRGNAHALMSSFNRVGCVWASAEAGLVTDILRTEFGFDGFVLTDMIQGPGASYMTTLDGLKAGTDLWFSSGDANFSAYSEDAAVVSRMRESAHRILYITANYSAGMNGWSSGTRLVPVITWWESALMTAVVFLSVLTAAALALYITSLARDMKESLVLS